MNSFIKTIAISIISLIVLSCTTHKSNIDDGVVYWVNSYKTQCVGVAPMQCMMVQKGNTLSDDAWTNFYNNIEGFDYKPGSIYKLKLKVEKIEDNKVAADASNTKYTLIEVIEKKIDLRLRLTDIWVLERIYDNNKTELINIPTLKKMPYIEIKVSTKSVMGFDGCNNFNGKIGSISEDKIEIKDIASTKMMCMDMQLTDCFNKTITLIHKYTIEDGKLNFKNKNEETIMVFKKVD